MSYFADNLVSHKVCACLIYSKVPAGLRLEAVMYAEIQGADLQGSAILDRDLKKRPDFTAQSSRIDVLAHAKTSHVDIGYGHQMQLR